MPLIFKATLFRVKRFKSKSDNMNKLLLLATLIFSTFSWSQTTKKVCFLGNSYTYVNDLPQMIADMATADGNTLVKDQNTPGGYTLQGHSTNGTSLSKIAADQWDYVVLQDQSQLPSFAWSQVQTDVLPYAAVLCDSIRSANACAIPLFYNTWGRMIGDPQWDSINTFDKMNQRLFNAYGYMADVNSGMRAPVGIGFNHVDDDLAAPITHTQLYQGDGSHPSVYGSYLAACMFYEIIFETSAQGNTFPPAGITPIEAIYLQDVAFHVLNDLDSVQTDYTQPIADFIFAHVGGDTQFTNLSEHDFEWLWNFGDGNTSTDENPLHTFSGTGPFTVTLTASNCGNSADTSFVVDLSVGFEFNPTPTFSIYPNPNNGSFKIHYSGAEEKASVFSIGGALIGEVEVNTTVFLDLIPGCYLIQINNKRERIIIQ